MSDTSEPNQRSHQKINAILINICYIMKFFRIMAITTLATFCFGCNNQLEKGLDSLDEKTNSIENTVTVNSNSIEQIKDNLSSIKTQYQKLEELSKALAETQSEIEILKVRLENESSKSVELQSRINELNTIVLSQNEKANKLAKDNIKQQLNEKFTELSKIANATNVGINKKEYGPLLVETQGAADFLLISDSVTDEVKLAIKAFMEQSSDASKVWDWCIANSFSGGRSVTSTSQFENKFGSRYRKHYSYDLGDTKYLKYNSVISGIWNDASVEFAVIKSFFDDLNSQSREK